MLKIKRFRYELHIFQIVSAAAAQGNQKLYGVRERVLRNMRGMRSLEMHPQLTLNSMLHSLRVQLKSAMPWQFVYAKKKTNENWYFISLAFTSHNFKFSSAELQHATWEKEAREASVFRHRSCLISVQFSGEIYTATSAKREAIGWGGHSEYLLLYIQKKILSLSLSLLTRWKVQRFYFHLNDTITSCWLIFPPVLAARASSFCRLFTFISRVWMLTWAARIIVWWSETWYGNISVTAITLEFSLDLN